MTSARLLASAARDVHRVAHLAHGLRDADEDGPTHYRMTDVQFLDLGNRCHGANVRHRQTVTSMNRQTEARTEGRAVLQRGKPA